MKSLVIVLKDFSNSNPLVLMCHVFLLVVIVTGNWRNQSCLLLLQAWKLPVCGMLISLYRGCASFSTCVHTDVNVQCQSDGHHLFSMRVCNLYR